MQDLQPYEDRIDTCCEDAILNAAVDGLVGDVEKKKRPQNKRGFSTNIQQCDYG